MISLTSEGTFATSKIRYEPFKVRVLFHTAHSDYFKQNAKMFDALAFIAEVTQQVSPKGV